MKPFTRPYERRHFKRFDLTTRDCRLTLIRRRSGERQSCILVNLSYAGLRFQGPISFRNGEMLEFLVTIADPMKRSGFWRGHVSWVCPIDSQRYDCGVEFVEECKGLLGPDEEWLPLATVRALRQKEW